MSHFEFIIPLQRDELRNSGPGEYKVGEISPIDKLNTEIQNCINSYNDEGCAYILDHFDTLYSVLVHFSKVEWPLIHKIFDKLILGSLNQLSYFIQPQVEDIPDSDSRTRSLNILKMNLYIFTQCHSCCHDRLSFECSTTVSDKVKGKKPKKLKTDESNWDWDERQRLALIALFQLLQLHISKLWDPPVPDEQFINMCANCCYKALEHPTIAHVKSKPLRETLFQVLGVLIKRYSHGISCVVKIVQMLTLYEHLVSPLANGVVMFVRDLGFKSLVNEIVRELMTSTDSTNDNTSVRSFSNFLVEVAEIQPEIMIPTTKELTKYLEQDPYSMRCCVLSVMTEILLSQLSHDDLDEKGKEQRDLYLDLLQEHSTDTNAFVRSRVLQLWQKIVQHNAVPKSKFLIVVDMTLERVLDKSSSVCKNAITLIKTILEQNPYGVVLDLRQLTNQLLQAEESLQSLERSAGSFKNMSREDIWQVLQPEVIVFLSTIIKFDSTEEVSDSQLTQLLTKDTIQENIKTIAILLTNRKYEQAFNLVKTVEQAFSVTKVIKASMPSNNTLEYYLTIMREMFMMYVPEKESSTDAPEKNISEQENTPEEIRVQKALVVYLMDCLEFTKKMEEAIEYVIAILNEESIAEVLESISFLSTAYQFGAPNCEKGVQEMLTLVSRKEPAIKEAVNAAYKNLYLVVPEKPSKREKAVEEANRLSKLAGSLDFGQLEGLTHLIVGWLKNKELDQEFIQVLWDRVKQPDSPKFNKQSALVLLSMVTLERPMTVKNELSVLVNEGLKVDCNNPRDMYSVIFTCKTILNIVLCKDSSREHTRFPPEHETFTLLKDIMKNSFTKIPGNDDFTLMAREVLNTAMELCTLPNKFCEDLLCDLFDIMNSDSTPSLNASNTTVSEMPVNTGIQNANPNETKLSEDDVLEPCEEKNTSTDTLIRFIFLVGIVAFKYGEFLENYYLETLKLKKRAEFKLLSPSSDVSKLMGTSRNSDKFKSKGEDEVITETDLLAAADDTATEEVRRILDLQVVGGDGIIAGFCKLVLEVCKSHKRYCTPNLKCVAAISLTQMMMVSSVFCNKHMQLLVTMLEKSPEEAVRSSLVVAFGDLLFKFPNTVEPWTRFLYARLRDESWKVRLSTLLVLSHLVTNEMVKVKGQISEVALCIVDENEVLQDLAKRFFLELSLKGNTLYNVLPDIISHLSNPASDIVIQEKDFETILKYVMEQIQKEKQLENLVEKLCKRMKESLCERQWKDLAFCLSLLPWSDRSLRKLLDHASCFCDRLLYQPVATLFLNIVTTVTKSTKPGLKEIGDELSAIVNDVLTKGSADHLHSSDEAMAVIPSKTPAKYPRKTPAKTPGTRKTTKKGKKVKKYLSDSEDDEFFDSNSDEDVKKQPVQSTRTRNPAVKLF